MKDRLKTLAAVVAALIWFALLVAGLRELFGNAIFWLLAAGFVGLVSVGIVAGIRRRRKFRRQGYEVLGGADHGFIFREKSEGGVREVRLPGELIENGHPVYYRLADEEWAGRVPEWALERKDEIEGRILEDPFHRP